MGYNHGYDIVTIAEVWGKFARINNELLPLFFQN
jgi:hypothetical protein